MGLEVSDGVGVVIGKFLNFIDAPPGKVDSTAITYMHIAVRNAESILRKCKLALIGSADDENHYFSPFSCHSEPVRTPAWESPSTQEIATPV